MKWKHTEQKMSSSFSHDNICYLWSPYKLHHYVFQRLGNMTFKYQMLNNSLSWIFKWAKFTFFSPPNVTVWMLSVIPAVFGKHVKCLSLKPTNKKWLATTEWHWHNKKETDPIFTTMDRLWPYLQFDDQSWKATVARLVTIWEIGKNICGLKKRSGKQETVLCLK